MTHSMFQAEQDVVCGLALAFCGIPVRMVNSPGGPDNVRPIRSLPFQNTFHAPLNEVPVVAPTDEEWKAWEDLGGVTHPNYGHWAEHTGDVTGDSLGENSANEIPFGEWNDDLGPEPPYSQ